MSKTSLRIGQIVAMVAIACLAADTVDAGGWRGGHGGHGGHHHHGGAWGSAWIGGPFWWPGFYGYPYPFGWSPWAYDYPYAYGYPGMVVLHGASAQATPRSTAPWHYCADSQMFYPHVSECPSGWQIVPATPPSETP